jgi:signal peptidase I
MPSKANNSLPFLANESIYPIDSCQSCKGSLFFAHVKCSMNPTLWDRDLLEVIPYSQRDVVQIGDVIVFSSPLDETIISHRVVSIFPDGICTKGDNNHREDPWRISRKAVFGRVVAASRNHKHRKIRGGQEGLLLANWDHINYRLRAKARGYLSPIYWSISNWAMLKKLGSRLMKLKVVKFKREDDNDILLLLGDKIIGRYNARKAAWDINYKYRLFIDESIFLDEDKIE